MKKTKLLAYLSISFLLAGCESGGAKAIKVQDINGPVELHTQAQLDFFNNKFYGDNVTTLDPNIKGQEELSRPLPVKLDWENTNCEKGYKVTISEYETLDLPWTYQTNEDKLDVYNLKTGTTYYYQVEENKENGKKSEVKSFTTKEGVRNLYIDGVTNVRDLGGWQKTIFNKPIKQGMIIRGGRLNNSYPYGSGNYGASYSAKDNSAAWYEREITQAGIEEFYRLGIKNEIDFRNSDGNGYPGKAEDEIIFENVPGVYYNQAKMSASDPLASSTRSSIKSTFEFLSKKNNYPVYFHCNIGTNRTGTVAMLLQALCGVEEEELLKDYMFSNFGTICVAERQYDKKPEPRAETTDVTVTNEVFYRIVNASGSNISEKAISVLKQAGVDEEISLKVKKLLLG